MTEEEMTSQALNFQNRVVDKKISRIEDLETQNQTLREIVELLKKANAFYGDKEIWKCSWDYPTHKVFRDISEHSVDTEWFEKEKRHIAGGVARSTQKLVEELEKKLEKA